MHCCLLLIVDVLCVIAANALATASTFGLWDSPASFTAIGIQAAVTTAFAVPAFLAVGINRTLWRFTSLKDCLGVLLAVALAVLAAAAVANVGDFLRGVPSQFPALQFLFMSCGLIGLRALARLRSSRRRLRRTQRSASSTQRKDVIVIGLNPLAELYLRYASEMERDQVAVAGILSPNRKHRGRSLRSYPILGHPEAIETVLLDLEIHGVRIDRIVLAERLEALSLTAQDALRKVERDLDIPMESLHQRFGLVDLFPSSDSNTERGIRPSVHRLGSHLIPNESSRDLRRATSYLRWKRAFDIMFATAALICFAPVILIVALLVAWDVGSPVFFWQRRPGVGGSPIRVFKFRTMRGARDVEGSVLSDADRLSAIGRILRRTRLDELPQIYNVLIGQMSLIGPRPLLAVDQSPRFAGRLKLKPGLTGWAQINGGRHLSQHDKAVLDLWYVRHASFALDARILMLTVRTIMFGEKIDRQAIDNAWLELRESSPAVSSLEEPREECAAAEPEKNWRWLKAGELRASAIEGHL